MNYILYTLLGSVGSIYLLWLFYLADMHLWKAFKAKQLSKTGIILGLPFMAVGGVLDFLVHVTLGTLVFWDFPKEWTLSARMCRYVETVPGTWRGTIANWSGATLLNVFDPTGKHIS